MFDKLVLILLGIFLLIYGLMTVTNIEIVWMKPICGLSALVAGVVLLIRAFSGGSLAGK